MAESKTVWLCNYNDARYLWLNFYEIYVQFPQLLAVKNFYKLLMLCNYANPSLLKRQQFKLALAELTAIIKTWELCQYIEPQQMPQQAFLAPFAKAPCVDEVAFKICDGFLLVNQKCVDVMRQFNLGKTHFSKVKISAMHQPNKFLAADYYFINIAEQREFVDVKTSLGITKFKNNAQQNKLWFIDNPQANAIKLFAGAGNNDIDLWHDPTLTNSLFFSNQLTQALQAAGINKSDLALLSCAINA